jgi:hypothetical protein
MKRISRSTGLLSLILFVLILFALVTKAEDATRRPGLPTETRTDLRQISDRYEGKIDEASSPYSAGTIFASPFVSYRFTGIQTTRDIRGAGGAGILGGVHVNDHVAIVGEGRTENTKHSVFDDVGGGLREFIPLGKSGLSFYAQELVNKGLEKDESWRIGVEGGLELRAAQSFGGFLGLRYDYAIARDTHAMMAIIGAQFRY